MLSAFIHSERGYPAMPFLRQLAHQRFVHPNPLVLRADLLRFPTPTADRDRPVSRRSKPSSRTTLIGEQPNPWDLLQPQDVMGRHRGAKQRRRYGLLGAISLLSPEYLLSVERRPFHAEIRRITKPWFPTCSTHRSRSQAFLYLYALRVIADHTENAIGLLRYFLGGDRPSQTAHITLFQTRIHGVRLGSKLSQGGISRATPDELAPTDQCLPPILHRLSLDPMLCCSKGSRGLSVLLRVRGIFTTTTISPSPWLRQRPSRYAIRAGRNLPDKELRYLRTLKVRAAVYRGFSSELRTRRF